ncbi:MAG TPA: exodeoxyribonuclease III [Flavobacteriales bacterium]|nr:exodeoxyribonuclease III [Flavobacteriales bacterium]
MTNYKIISWNVNGIRASVKKGFIDIVKNFDADFFLVQETKASIEIVSDICKDLPGYSVYANEAEKKGYSGTAIFSKHKPIASFTEMPIDEHNEEGRISGLEFDKFFLVNVYVPNSGNELKRLDYRKNWDRDFCSFLSSLAVQKPVIVGGDFNVAHTEIDLARPKSNYNKTAGYTQVEIDGMDAFATSGLVDSFRILHPDRIEYTFWSQRFKARERNVGWRIDYFLVSERVKENIKSAEIYGDVMGSDHCPIGLELKF